MNPVNSLKIQLVEAGLWLGEDPRRVQLMILATTALAAVAAIFASANTSATLFAGMVGGGSGGSG